jgi:uncharacterized membrane protein YdjX (TVP38/TMEM64 family)
MRNETKKNKNNKDRTLVWIFIYFCLNALSAVLAVLCLYAADVAFIQKHARSFSMATGVFFLILYGFSSYCATSEKLALKRSILSVYFVIAFLLALLFLLQRCGFFALVRDKDALQSYLQSAGRWMSFAYIALQYAQVVLLPIPGIVSTLAGVALFGAVKAMLYSVIGIVAGSMTAFVIGRKLGFKAVSWLIGKENLRKWQRKLKGKDNLFLILAFLLPVFPDDILCFLAGLSSMSTACFFWIILFTRIVSVGATCFSFNLIPFTTWWGVAIWFAIVVGLALLFVVLLKNFDKVQKTLNKWRKLLRKKKQFMQKTNDKQGKNHI